MWTISLNFKPNWLYFSHLLVRLELFPIIHHQCPLSTAHLPALAALGSSAPPLKAVYSRSEKSAQDLAQTAATILNLPTPPPVYHDGNKSTNLDALLARNDISAVIIVLPITTQPSIILKALAAGKHVISEKPVAADVQSGLKLIADYDTNFKSKNLIWRVAENFEAEPGFQAAGAAIRAGKIGQVQSFKAGVVNYINTESKWYKTPWRTVPDVSSSVEFRSLTVSSLIRLFFTVSRWILGMFSFYTSCTVWHWSYWISSLILLIAWWWSGKLRIHVLNLPFLTFCLLCR